ncbi:MAG: COR domain-containing protein [Bacteroidia bacterium]
MTDLEQINKLEKLLSIDFLKNPDREIDRKPFFITNEFDEIVVLSLSGKDLSKSKVNFNLFKSLEDLRLSFCELKELPGSVFEITKLKRLQITGNDLKSISGNLKNLTNLEWLSLRRCSIKDLPKIIFDLKKLKILNVSANYISSIPDEILKLEKLESLDLGHNKFETFPEVVGDINSLKIFEYYGNDLNTFPTAITNIKNLFHLHLTGCGLKAIPDTFRNFQKLKILELGNNQLREIPQAILESVRLSKLKLASNFIKQIPESISSLKNLESLDLSDNELTELPVGLLELENLKELDLHRNNLNLISAKISSLKNLNTLNLSNNSIKEIPFELSQIDNVYLQNNQISAIPYQIVLSVKEISYSKKSFLSSFNFNGNPVSIPPLEVVSNGRDACIAWYKSQQEQTSYIKELKVLVIGDGAAGKTSLINRICDNKFNSNESTTHGINIRRTSLNTPHFNFIENFKDADVNLNIWDFGGQEIMHASHQFFLSRRALYILVIDSRKDQKTEYWLNHIVTFGGDSPVLIAMNKIDDNPSHELNRKSLQDKYPVKGFFPLSCKDGRGLQEFFKGLAEEVSNSTMLKEKWNLKWLAVKNTLQLMKQNYVSYENFLAICRQNDLTDKEQQKTLLGYLHSLGIVLHFPDFELKDTNVLNPKWVTEAVYKIINSKLLAEKKGILDKNDLDYILNEEQSDSVHDEFKLNVHYTATEQNHIINLMFKFELCYNYSGNSILVPDLLIVEEPDFPFNYKDALKYILEYEFLPKSIIARFIVKMNMHVNKDLNWRTGVVLTYDGNEAVVKSDETTKRISVWVNGIDKRGYFSVIRSVFMGINKNLQHLPEELIPCICTECKNNQTPYFFKYSVLLKAKQRQKFDWPCERSSENVKILNMIDDIIMEAPEQIKENKRTKLFISYAHNDIIWLDRLKIHLKAIANEGLEINVWDDTLIKAGMNWKNEIQKTLNQTKIAILLISTEFLASDFIISNELPALLKAAETNGAYILSLIIKPSRFTKNQALSQFQAVNDPARPLINLTEGEQDLILVNLTNRIEEIMTIESV